MFNKIQIHRRYQICWRQNVLWFDYSFSMGLRSENTIKWFPSQFLLLWLLTCFFDGSRPDITGSSRVSAAHPQKAPADHSSRRGGVGYRGRSYQRAAECEGQKSWCIQAHHTVTRHSSAQGPSEQAALTLNRLLMSSPAQGLSSKRAQI